MTTQDKLRYLNSLFKLLVGAKNYAAAREYATFLRGTIAAWNVDNTLPLADVTRIQDNIKVVLDTKKEVQENTNA